MNFLGHIFFSNDDLDLMHANLFGDFIKGSNLEAFTPEIRNGIILHRSIDSFIDQHHAVKLLSRKLSSELPKVAPIAIDLFFDHFLFNNWSMYHNGDLAKLLNDFYNYKIDKNSYPNDRFHFMLKYLKSEKWISSYGTLEGIGQACKGVSNRISFPNALVNGQVVLEKNYLEIESTFHVFMKDALDKFNSEGS